MKLPNITFDQEGVPNRVFTDIELWVRKEDLHHVFKAHVPSPTHIPKQPMVRRFEGHIFEQAHEGPHGPQLHGAFQVFRFWQLGFLQGIDGQSEEVVGRKLHEQTPCGGCGCPFVIPSPFGYQQLWVRLGGEVYRRAKRGACVESENRQLGCWGFNDHLSFALYSSSGLFSHTPNGDWRPHLLTHIIPQ